MQIISWLNYNESILSATVAIITVVALVYITLYLLFRRGFSKNKKSTSETPEHQAGHQDFSLAVLRFAALSTEQSDEYLATGLSAEIIALVTSVKQIRVSATNSAFRFEAGNTDW